MNLLSVFPVFGISHCFLRVQGCSYTIQPCTRQLHRILNDRATSNHEKVGKTPIMVGSLAFGLYALDYEKLPSGLQGCAPNLLSARNCLNMCVLYMCKYPCIWHTLKKLSHESRKRGSKNFSHVVR